MEINLKITVRDDGAIVTSSNVDFGCREHDLNASVIMVGALEITKNAILADRFKCLDGRKGEEEE